MGMKPRCLNQTPYTKLNLTYPGQRPDEQEIVSDTSHASVVVILPFVFLGESDDNDESALGLHSTGGASRP